MRRSRVLWLLAFAITVTSAIYQRATGPTHPRRGKVTLAGREVRYSLPRSMAGGDAEVRVPAASPQTRGTLAWKRHNSRDGWTYLEMAREGDQLAARLPQQPPAGKLAYRVILQDGSERVTLGGQPVIIRFRGEVPLPVLVLHIIAMFGAMLAGTRAGLEFFRRAPDYGRLPLWTLGLLTLGGLVLGPIVQKYAFGAYWTGWPFGTDLTDNKTAVAWLAWILAWIRLRRAPEKAGAWVLGAAIVMMAVFAIPHSLLGSELK
ncbi:MAG: hypothetical protein ACOYX1_12745 [Acidobacteriota bacterium]